MIKITIACRPNGKKLAKVQGADVAYAVAAWNRCWWAEGANRLSPSDQKIETLVAAVLALPAEISASITFSDL